MPGDVEMENQVLVPIPSLQQVPRGYLRIRSILKQLHAMPTLMHVVRGGDAAAIATPDVRSASQVLSYEYAEMKQSVLKIGARITNYAEEVHSVIRFGQVADEILKELKTGSYSYLVMAVRKRGLLPTFIESTAYQILSLAPVPVLTVKKGE
jgi:nucleotide-binding universal stress UspA family protein